jgi:hypothetical protein
VEDVLRVAVGKRGGVTTLKVSSATTYPQVRWCVARGAGLATDWPLLLRCVVCTRTSHSSRRARARARVCVCVCVYFLVAAHNRLCAGFGQQGEQCEVRPGPVAGEGGRRGRLAGFGAAAEGAGAGDDPAAGKPDSRRRAGPGRGSGGRGGEVGMGVGGGGGGARARRRRHERRGGRRIRLEVVKVQDCWAVLRDDPPVRVAPAACARAAAQGRTLADVCPSERCLGCRTAPLTWLSSCSVQGWNHTNPSLIKQDVILLSAFSTAVPIHALVVPLL